MILTKAEYGSPVSVIPPAIVDDIGPHLEEKKEQCVISSPYLKLHMNSNHLSYS